MNSKLLETVCLRRNLHVYTRPHPAPQTTPRELSQAEYRTRSSPLSCHPGPMRPLPTFVNLRTDMDGHKHNIWVRFCLAWESEAERNDNGHALLLVLAGVYQKLLSFFSPEGKVKWLVDISIWSQSGQLSTRRKRPCQINNCFCHTPGSSPAPSPQAPRTPHLERLSVTLPLRN